MPHYPLRTEGYYPKNQWYIAAWAHEVGRSVFARTIFGERVAMYRTQDGAVAAISGLCPHRLLPFEHGTVVGDAVQCAYHGLQFDKTGACVAAPGSDLPPNGRVRTFPVAERWKWIWIWTGDPAAADEALLPDLQELGLGEPGWETMENVVFHLAARPQLYLENLFDLSHIAFLHSPSLATSSAEIGANDTGRGDIFLEPIEISKPNGQLTVSRQVTFSETPQSFRYTFPHAPNEISVETATRMVSPALVDGGRIRVRTNRNDRNSADVGTLHILHGITPETEHSSHIFMLMNRDYMLDDRDLQARLRKLNTNIMNEDLVALRAIEPYADAADLKDEISVQADAGGLQARRLIERLIQSEAAQTNA